MDNDQAKKKTGNPNSNLPIKDSKNQMLATKQRPRRGLLSALFSSEVPTPIQTPAFSPKQLSKDEKFRHIIFRKPISLPEKELVNINRPIDDTAYLTRVLQELPPDSARKEPLALLSHQIVEQFGLRLVRTPAILQEVIALGSIPDTELLNKILHQFVRLLHQESVLDVDLLEGLAILLETAHPYAMKARQSVQSDEKKSAPSTMEDLLKKVGISGATSNKIIGLRNAFQTSLIKNGLIKKGTSEGKSFDEKKTEDIPKEKSLVGKTKDRYSQIPHLLSLIDILTDKYVSFHRQAQTTLQEAELLRALARILDAMRDIGVTGINQDKVRKKVYDALAKTANDTQVDLTVSLWANYAIQALIRLEDNGSVVSEWISRGKSLLTVIKSLKEVWNSWDLTQLPMAYATAKEAFHFDHQPESWYESLWYCQLLIRAGQFQALEEYLYKNKTGQSETLLPLCPDRCLPTFQLGLMAALDGVLRDSKWPDGVKMGCLQLLQDMFLNQTHWYTEPAKSLDQTWRDYLRHTAKAAKKLMLYSGQAYHAQQEIVQGAIIDQLVAYLDEPTLCQQAQGILSALRHPSVKPPLTRSQSQLLEEHAPLAKILKVSTSGTQPSKRGQTLLVPAREAMEKHLVWKLETLRSRTLTSSDVEQALAYYVPPKSILSDEDKELPFDLMESSLHFLGLIQEDPANKRTPAELETKESAESMEEEKEEEEDGEEKEKKVSRSNREEKSLTGSKAYSSVASFGVVNTQDLSRCTLDCHLVTGTVDPTFITQWRRNYGNDLTRFLLVYCEDTESKSSSDTASGSWYFVGQTGEGEYLEGILQDDQAWLKTVSVKAKNYLTTLAQDLKQLFILVQSARSITALSSPVAILQDDQAEVTRKMKQDLLQGLHHLIVVNRKPLDTSTKTTVLLLTAGAGSGKSTYGVYLQRFYGSTINPVVTFPYLFPCANSSTG